MAEPFGRPGAVLKRGCAGDQPSIRRGEGADRVLQNLLRAAAEHDVLRLDPVLRRERGHERPVVGRAVERIAARRRELADDCLEHRLARTDWIFVAVDADFRNAWWHVRASGPILRVGLTGLRPSRCDESAGKWKDPP